MTTDRSDLDPKTLASDAEVEKLRRWAAEREAEDQGREPGIEEASLRDIGLGKGES